MKSWDKCELVSSVTQNTYSRTQLSEPTGRHTIRSDKRGVRIDEMESCSAESWGSVGDNW